MNEKSDAILRTIVQILNENGEAGYEILTEFFPESEYGGYANTMYERLRNLPELRAIDHLCVVMSGELARHPNSSKLELSEAENIARMLNCHAERLIEIGQENEKYDGLIVAGSTLESIGRSIQSLLDHNDRKGLK